MVERLYKKLVFIFVCGILYYIFLLSILELQFKAAIDSNTQKSTFLSLSRNQSDSYPRNHPSEDMKYILLWPSQFNPFHLIEYENTSFIYNKCMHSNCYVTDDMYYFQDTKKFHAIVFSGCSLGGARNFFPDENRSVKQKFVFACIEPAPSYPVSNPIFENFFNWTWTYRLDSDITWKYLTIYDLNGTVVGPSKDMKWPNLKPTKESVKRKLRLKSKPVAWIVSHCRTSSHRENFFERFKSEFEKYGWSIDVFGKCGLQTCGKDNQCYKMLERHYHFYLSFENSFDADYVTEKLLTALNNLMVPVVYGGADYSRFMPPGSYLNAKELGPKKLAEVMDRVLRNKTVYYEYFRWTNHFQYKTSEKLDVCNICTALNKESVTKTSVYPQFRIWWNTADRQKMYDFMVKVFMSSKSLLDLANKYNYTRQSSSVLLENMKNLTSWKFTANNGMFLKTLRTNR